MKHIIQIGIYLCICCTIFAQQPVQKGEDIFLILNERQTKLKDILRKIESQTPYLFLYNESQINMNRRFTVRMQTNDIHEIIDYLSTEMDIRYEIMDIQILLLPAEKSEKSGIRIPVTGKITDENGHPMEFVSVYDELSGRGSLTDTQGAFRIYTGHDSCKLHISYVGYENITTGIIKLPEYLNIKLIPAIYHLEDVVAIGYGTLTRRELTSAVGFVSSEQFLQGRVNNPIMGVKGLVSGMSISGASLSDINSTPDIQIRGAGSIIAGNNPLIVVDGIPGVSLNSLSISDIESVSVLKDGASASIYGSNGANGVVLITTKTGKPGGKLQASYHTYIAASQPVNKPVVLSAEEFALRGRDTNYRNRTDWYDLLVRNLPFEHYHDFSIQNGWEGGAFRFSGNFRDGDGLDIASSRREYALRSYMHQTLLSGHLEFTASLTYKKQLKYLGNHEAFEQAIMANPTAPVYQQASTGEYLFPSGFSRDNPVAMLKEERREQDNRYVTGSVTTRINFTKELYTKMVMAENREDIEESAYWTSYAKESADNNRKGRAERVNASQIHRMLEWTGHYENVRENHSWKGLAGYSWQRWENATLGGENADFPTDFFNWNNLEMGSYLQEGRASLFSSKNASKLISIFTRLNYSYKDLIMLSVSYRREGSSKFGANHKWGNFPAVSGGIRLTELSGFHSPEWLDDLKFRSGYGVSGRHQLSPYQSLDTYGGGGMFFGNGKWMQVFGPGNNPNPDLRWEKSLHTNIGAEGIFFHSSLIFSLDYFRRTTKDLLFEYNAIKPPMIHNNIITNVGIIDTDGVEWEIVWNPVRKDQFRFSSTLTGSYTKSRLRSLSDDQFTLGYTYLYTLPSPGNPGPAIRLEEGKPVGAFYGWKYAGVDDNGNILIYDKENKIVPAAERSEEDKDFIGNGIPKVQLAWSNSFKIKHVDMRLFFTSWLGYNVLNLKQMYHGLQHLPMVNLLQDAYTRNNHITGDKIYCDYFIEKGDFLKLEEVSIGYHFPLKKNEWIQDIQCYFAVNNVYTLTRYTGREPSNVNVNGVEPGIDAVSLYPAARTFTIGLSMQF